MRDIKTTLIDRVPRMVLMEEPRDAKFFNIFDTFFGPEDTVDSYSSMVLIIYQELSK